MPDLKKSLAEDAQKTTAVRRQVLDAVRKVGASPPEVQIAFLKGLLENKAEAEKFIKDPKGYAVEHGVLLDPEVVHLAVNTAVFYDDVPRHALKWREEAVQELIDMRGGGGTKAVPAAVAAGAAVVAAAAAVVTMVVTLVRAKKPEDLNALRGLGPDGIILPGGGRFNSGGMIR